MSTLETFGPKMIALFSHFILRVSGFVESPWNSAASSASSPGGKFFSLSPAGWLLLNPKLHQPRLPRAELLNLTCFVEYTVTWDFLSQPEGTFLALSDLFEHSKDLTAL